MYISEPYDSMTSNLFLFKIVNNSFTKNFAAFKEFILEVSVIYRKYDRSFGSPYKNKNK